MLKHYRSSIKDFFNFFDSINLDIDFSENLTFPVKHQPQSLHWSYTQITIHSGILKGDGVKTYHAYVSNNLKHDKTFVKVVIDNMLKDANTDIDSEDIVEVLDKKFENSSQSELCFQRNR